MEVFCSNRVERLFQHLKNQFCSSSPFIRRILVVPNQAVKAWLLLQFAQDIGIATGWEFLFLHQFFEINRIPSSLELTLALEKEIRLVLEKAPQLSSTEKQLWSPLLGYLSNKSEKKLITLTEKLASLFAKYGVFGGNMVAAWKSNMGWQQELWLRLFESGKYPWSYPEKELNKAPPFQDDREIHFFAINFLSKAQYRYLQTRNVPVSMYFLSPCRAFWLDIHSDRETKKLKRVWKSQCVSEAKQSALDEFLRDRNPILANFGRLGREMAAEIEAWHAQTNEEYEIAAGVSEFEAYFELMDEELQLTKNNHPLTLLEAVQADLLLLRNPDKHPKIQLMDHSIQLHCAPSRFREVEVLYHTLLGLIDKHRQDESPICCGDIIVMAPDIMQYEAYIKVIFGNQESRLDFQIMDLRIAAQSALVQAFLHLLKLTHSRWEATEIIQLFEYPDFQRRHGLSIEDIQQFREWVKKLGIRWGEDEKHRNELLKKAHCEHEMVDGNETGTWDYGITRLLTQGVESTNGDLLGKVIRILRSLREDLKPLEDRTFLTLEEWASYLTCMLEGYFTIDPKDQSAQENLKALKQHLETLGKAGKALEETGFTFASVFARLEALLNQETLSYRENRLQAVRFCSMLPMRAIPAKAICLLGMEEGVFPKPNEPLSLNLMQGGYGDYCPTSTEYDRYLFLEVLLSARQVLIMSYSAPNDEAPSLLVSELMGYLDKSYDIGEKCTVRHPFFPFDASYFTQDNPLLRSYSMRDWRAAQAFYQKEKQPGDQMFLTLFKDRPLPFDQTQGYLDVKHLIEVARNPLKTYFRAMGVYLPSEDNEIKNSESFTLSTLEHALLRNSGLMHPIDTVLSAAEKEGRLPPGLFKDVSHHSVKHQVNECLDNLRKMDVDLHAVMSVELHPACKEPYQNEKGSWMVPPLNLAGVHIIGKIPYVAPQGLIAHSGDKLKDMVKVWPYYLLLHCLEGLPIAKQLLFTKSKKPKYYSIQNPMQMLERYVEYYFLSRKNASLLIPEWIELLIKHDSKTFQEQARKSLKNDFNPLYNEHLEWMLCQSDFPEEVGSYERWRKQAIELFGDIA